jgi:RNA polymerase sigma-70 factor (ECF subfamily)
MAQDTLEVWRKVQDRLRAFVARRVESEAETDDILQEVFLRVHQRLDGLKDQRRLAPWLFQIARHAIVDHYRTPARRREVPVGLASDLDADRSAPAPPFAGMSPDSAELRAELAACLRPMIGRLSAPYREAVMLVELDGVTQQAAAKRLGLSPSGVKSRVQRGRRQLKRMLDECCLIQLDRRGGVAEYALRDARCNPCGALASSRWRVGR